MKTRPLDFLLSAVALALISIITLVTVRLITPLSLLWFGDFHIVAESLMFLLCFGMISALLTRMLLIVQPLRAGEYGMDEAIFTYWKLLTVIYEFGRGALLPFTTVFARPLVAIMFGAKVGGNVALGGRIADPPLVTLGQGAVLGHNSLITPHAVTSGRIILREIKIGRGVTLGVNVVVMPGSEVGAGSVVAAGSVLPPDTKIPGGELWGGTPARKIKVIDLSDFRY